MVFEEKAVKSEEIYRGRIINVRNDTIMLPDGRTASREVVEHQGGVCVAAVDNGCLLLVKQFRYPFGQALYEVPAGKLEPGEDPEACGRRELLEETGASAGYFEKLGELYPSPGFLTEVIHVYYAAKLTFSRARPDADEYLDVERLPLSDVFKMADTGLIRDAKTVGALYYLTRRLELAGDRHNNP